MTRYEHLLLWGVYVAWATLAFGLLYELWHVVSRWRRR